MILHHLKPLTGSVFQRRDAGNHFERCCRGMCPLGIIIFVSGGKKRTPLSPYLSPTLNKLNGRIFRDNLVKKEFQYWQMTLKNIVIRIEQIKTVFIWHQTSGRQWKKLVKILDVLFT